MFIKRCVFSQFTATHPLHVEEQFILARDPKAQTLILVDQFCTANTSCAGEGEVANYRQFLEKTQCLMNTLYKPLILKIIDQILNSAKIIDKMNTKSAGQPAFDNP